MKVRDLLEVTDAGQIIEFNYIDKDGYFTAYDMPKYVKGISHELDVYLLLDRDIDRLYSSYEGDYSEVEYDYITLVLKEEL